MIKSRYKPKIEKTLSPETFFARLEHFSLSTRDQAFLVLLYYTGIRVTEALNLTYSSFTEDFESMFIDVGKRLKHGRKTDKINLDLNKPGITILSDYVRANGPGDTIGEAVFNFSRITAWKICKKIGVYPHYFRFNRITQALLQGKSIAEIKGMMGISVVTIDKYILEVKTRRAWNDAL